MANTTKNIFSIEANLKSKKFILQKGEGKSNIWTTFGIVYDGKNKLNYSACKTCYHVYSYDKGHGTSHMRRHKCSFRPESVANKITSYNNITFNSVNQFFIMYYSIIIIISFNTQVKTLICVFCISFLYRRIYKFMFWAGWVGMGQGRYGLGWAGP